MIEDTTPERIPFEEHPLYPLYKAGRQQWNRFMVEYITTEQKTEIAKRNPTMKDDFEAKKEEKGRSELTDEQTKLTDEQKDIFNQYIAEQTAKPKRFFCPLDFENYIFDDKIRFKNHLFPTEASFRNSEFTNSVDFESAQFLRTTCFQGAQFSNVTIFQSAQFSNLADFQSAQFSNLADFQSAQFSNLADFQSAQFSSLADFKDTRFLSMADFKAAEFSFVADFQTAQFSKQANFQHTQFLSVADFQSARFSDLADFKSAQFSSRARFNSVEFAFKADFQNAQFSERANFIKATFKRTIDFSNAQFKAKTDFTGTTFECYVPEFYEVALHQNTIFDNAIWPDSSNIQDERILSSNQSPYNQLVLEMNRQLRHELELYFFAKELETKRYIHWHRKQFASWLLNCLYYAASKYGRSIRRPIILIFISFMISLIFNCINYFDDAISKSSNFETVLRYTFLDFLPGGPLLQQRAVAGLFEATELHPPPLWLDMVNSFASVAILAGFFLLGLGLRNRFRIR